MVWTSLTKILSLENLLIKVERLNNDIPVIAMILSAGSQEHSCYFKSYIEHDSDITHNDK